MFPNHGHGLPVLLVFLAVAAPATARETLYNGIELPDEWPPKSARVTREPGSVPYLEEPPAVIRIDVGRQLFVDDFLIATTNLHRTFHQGEYHSTNPVLTPGEPGGEKRYELYAAPLVRARCARQPPQSRGAAGSPTQNLLAVSVPDMWHYRSTTAGYVGARSLMDVTGAIALA